MSSNERVTDKWLDGWITTLHMVSGCTNDLAIALDLQSARQTIKDLRDVLLWLQGENGDFRQRLQGEGAYWWRKELRQRLAALTPPAAKEDES